MRQTGSRRPTTARDPALRAKIDRALAGNAIAQAAKLAETALSRGDVDPMLLNRAAWQREESGDYAGAHRLLRQSSGGSACKDVSMGQPCG